MKGYRKICGGLLFVLLLFQSASPGPATAEEAGFTPIPVIKGIKLLPAGTPAPLFTVKDVNGESYNFAEHLKKSAHILVFWSIFCEPCREEMPIIEEVYGAFKEKGLEVLAINLDGEPFIDGIKGFIKQNSFTFRVLLDELDDDIFTISDPYQVAGTPVLYLVDKEGQVFGGHLGRMTAKDLKDLVNSMLDKG